MESERDAFKAKFEALKKERKKLSDELKSAEDNLVEATSTHDEVVFKKV